MKPVLLVGNGPMAESYAKVLRDGLKRPFSVAGRNAEHVARFRDKHGAESRYTLAELDERIVAQFEYVIVTTSRDSLQDVSEGLLELKARALLIEKPVSSSATLSRRLEALVRQRSAIARVALNRRYYRSVHELRNLLRSDEPLGAYFDFTELAHRIPFDRLPASVVNRWALGNSIHVFDTVRFLLGDFCDIRGIITGQGDLAWHPTGAQFLGVAHCGDVPVSYASSWSSPGRWEIQVMAQGGRYKLSPMERLQVLRPKTFDWADVEADYSLDEQFKPGLYRMLEEFDALVTKGAPCDLPDIASNTRLLQAISEIVGYPL